MKILVENYDIARRVKCVCNNMYNVNSKRHVTMLNNINAYNNSHGFKPGIVLADNLIEAVRQVAIY